MTIRDNRGRVKRNRKQNKQVKLMFWHLDQMLGEQDAGLFLAMCLDLLTKCCSGVEERELRTLEIKINDFFSKKIDFRTMKVE